MKKFYSMAALFLMGATAAQAQFINLDKTKVIYTTSDTVTVDAGEKISFSSSSLVNGFNAAGLALEGTDSKDNGFQIAFTKDYTDEETGFTMPKGYYRGVEVQGTYGLSGKFVKPDLTEVDAGGGFTNIKKVILYFVPAGYFVQHENGYDVNNWQTLFSGRVQASYTAADDTGKVAQISNTAYREVTCSNEMKNTDDWKNCISLLTDVLNWKLLDDDAFTLGYNSAYITMDQPYKLSVDLTNSASTSDLESLLQEGKKAEFTSANMSGTTETNMTYYFADPTDCSSSTDDADAAASSTGYNCYTGKWGKKVDWSASTGVKVAIKKGMILVGLALVSATEGAEKEYLDPTIGIEAAWSSDPNQAYGSNEGEMPADPWADRRIGSSGIKSISSTTNANAEYFNVMGQKVSKDAKGLIITNGKKFINK